MLRALLKNNQFRKFMALLLTLTFNCIPGFYLRAYFLRCLGFQIGNKVALHSWIRFFDFNKNLSIGSNVTINPGCYIDNREAIKIGSNVNISHNVKIYTQGHDVDDPYAKLVGKGVVIHDHAWIFPNVLIMPGVVVGEGAVIYPGSVVTKSINEYEIVGGNPAQKIRLRNRDVRYEIDYQIWFAL